jgi:queuine tRNA-ribosyltransferase
MMFSFKIIKKGKGLARAGIIHTTHGDIETPSFVVVGTKATVKALTTDMVRDLGAQVVLANTYHLYLQPGDELVAKAGGLHNFMRWNGPIMTDSGGFQAFSLGVALGEGISKLRQQEIFSSSRKQSSDNEKISVNSAKNKQFEKMRAKITEDGVTFKSHIDGSTHTLTPERSIEIQHNLGADIIFAFDECTSPTASYEYQKDAMERTHRWAERSLARHKSLTGGNAKQALFGVVQGGRYQDLREQSARFISRLDFDGFGIGGSFDAKDIYTAVGWVNNILPEDKPRHLLGIGEPLDFFGGVENGIDTFDCVIPTRMGRNGNAMTAHGRVNLNNSRFQQDFSPIEDGCGCYACSIQTDGRPRFSKAYIAHLLRAREMLAATLISIHNLYFSVNVLKKIRQSIIEDNFIEYKKEFIAQYKK